MKAVTITECDLQAYVDDQLDVTERLEVADYLVRNPEVAARVLVDLSLRDSMRAIAHDAARAASPAAVEKAQRIDAVLDRKRTVGRLGRAAELAAALAVVVAVGGTAQFVDFTPRATAAVPRLVQEALMSQQTAELRADMPSQPETRDFDARAVRQATRIDVPELPADWRLLDAQLFPSDYGPSVQMVIDTGGAAPVSLFAARSESEFPEEPHTQVIDGQAVGYWSHDGTVYALTGDQMPESIAEHAEDLASSQDG